MYGGSGSGKFGNEYTSGWSDGRTEPPLLDLLESILAEWAGGPAQEKTIRVAENSARAVSKSAKATANAANRHR